MPKRDFARFPTEVAFRIGSSVLSGRSQHGTIMESTHEGLYPGLDDLPEKARLVHVFPKLTSGALMSVP